MIVLDASVAVDALLHEGPSRDLMDRERCVVPHIIDAEVLHSLRRRGRLGTLADIDARRALAVWQRLALTRHTAVGLLDRVWELRENLTAYDALYVALAEGLGLTLVTADARLSRAPGVRCPVTVLPER